MTEGPDQKEFREVFLAHREPVYRLLVRLTGNPHDAEDLAQDTFVTYWRKRRQYRGEGGLGSYLRRIAYRTWLNSRSRLAARRPPRSLACEPPDRAASAEARVDEADSLAFFRRKVAEALESLPPGARESFLLFRYEGLSVAEVAEVTGVPVRTVESRLRRAMRHVRERLSRYRDRISPR